MHSAQSVTEINYNTYLHIGHPPCSHSTHCSQISYRTNIIGITANMQLQDRETHL